MLAICVLGCGEQALQTSARQDTSELHAADGPLAALPQPLARSETFQRGVILGPIEAPESEAAFKRAYTARLDRALALGASDLRLMVRWLQTDLQATEIAPYDSVHDDLLSWLVDQAKRRKLRVSLAPVLAVEDQGERAPGELAPRSWERWWWSYQRFMLHYARFSGMRKVSMLTVGSGLTSAEPQTERWRALIHDVRKIYKGKLTYEASAASFERVAFWDALELVSVAVAQPDASSEAKLLEQLAPLARRLSRSNVARERGYLITEASCGAGATDARRAALCQRALFHSFGNEAQLQGVYARPALEPDEVGGSAHSAAEVVRHWYGKSRS